MVEHVEKYVAPTITSDQILGGKPFRFKDDHRPTVAMVIADDEYRTEATLPAFASSHLLKDYRVELRRSTRRGPATTCRASTSWPTPT